MKTSKTSGRPGDSHKDAGTVKSKKVIISRSAPDEEEISERARDIYHQRIERGEQ